MSFFKKIFGERESSQVKKIRPTLEMVNSFENAIKNMTDKELRAKTQEFKARLSKGETTDDLLGEAFAVVREAGVRTIGLRHYDVQVIGGIVLHQGRIAEMKTGEGKTLVSTLAAYLNALSGKGVHIVTVNDYLAKRDAQWMGKIHKFLGLKVGVILSQMSPEDRREAYACDITYGTNSEFGFDYLRDNMCVYKSDMVQRDLHFAIVDEVDSILIDEARTPLIISGKGADSTEMYVKADQFVRSLVRGEDTTEQSKFETMSMTSEEAFANTGDYTIDEKMRTVSLTNNGVDKAEAFFGVERLTDADNTELNHHISQALKANYLFKIDVDYVIQEEQIMIVDEFTGRIMHGRRYSEGLHQAIEAKEGVKVKNESKTLATITYQNFFRMYGKLSGMTGTAKTEEDEFQGIYKLDVVVIPTNRPNVRVDNDDVIYIEEDAKEKAVIDEIVEEHQKQRPILVGTISVEKSEHLGRLLALRGVAHVVLNAKNHKKEADIVAQAGQLGVVTIATNMAGRGTDILLGGNPDYLARRAMRQQGLFEEMIEDATGHAETDDQEILAARDLYAKLYAEFKKETDVEHDKVVALGGLHIIGTERHESRRIDNQLRGRAGRQGDPGSTKFFLSLDDDLLRLFGGENLKKLAGRFSSLKDTPMEMGMLTKQIENAQKRVEGMHFNSRKHVLQYDDVMNKQREIIYAQRRRVLVGEDISDAICEMTANFITQQVDTYCAAGVPTTAWDFEGLRRKLEMALLPEGEKLSFAQILETKTDESKTKAALLAFLLALAKQIYAGRTAELEQYNLSMRDAEREVMLRVVDMHWMDHIDAMDQLRDGINLQAYGQRDPAQEYAVQGFEMFEHMIESINETTITALMHVSVQGIPKERKSVSSGEIYAHQAQEQGEQTPEQNFQQAQNNSTQAPQPFVDQTKKVGRNDPCPCGSGKKYKSCHGKASAQD